MSKKHTAAAHVLLGLFGALPCHGCNGWQGQVSLSLYRSNRGPRSYVLVVEASARTPRSFELVKFLTRLRELNLTLTQAHYNHPGFFQVDVYDQLTGTLFSVGLTLSTKINGPPSYFEGLVDLVPDSLPAASFRSPQRNQRWLTKVVRRYRKLLDAVEPEPSSLAAFATEILATGRTEVSVREARTWMTDQQRMTSNTMENLGLPVSSFTRADTVMFMLRTLGYPCAFPGLPQFDLLSLNQLSAWLVSQWLRVARGEPRQQLPAAWQGALSETTAST